MRVEEARRRHEERGIEATGISQNETFSLGSCHFKAMSIKYDTSWRSFIICPLLQSTVLYDLCQMSIKVLMTDYMFILFHIISRWNLFRTAPYDVLHKQIQYTCVSSLIAPPARLLSPWDAFWIETSFKWRTQIDFQVAGKTTGERGHEKTHNIEKRRAPDEVNEKRGAVGWLILWLITFLFLTSPDILAKLQWKYWSHKTPSRGGRGGCSCVIFPSM